MFLRRFSVLALCVGLLGTLHTAVGGTIYFGEDRTTYPPVNRPNSDAA